MVKLLRTTLKTNSLLLKKETLKTYMQHRNP